MVRYTCQLERACEVSDHTVPRSLLCQGVGEGKGDIDGGYFWDDEHYHRLEVAVELSHSTTEEEQANTCIKLCIENNYEALETRSSQQNEYKYSSGNGGMVD